MTPIEERMISDLTQGVQELKKDLDWRVGNVTSNFSAIKEQMKEIQKEESGHYRGVVKAFNERISALEGQIEEIEKSIADQAIKALHTHPEMIHYMSATTTRLAQIETRLDDLEKVVAYPLLGKTSIEERLDKLEKWKDNADEGMNNGAKRREQLEERLNTFSWRMAKVEEWVRSFPKE